MDGKMKYDRETQIASTVITGFLDAQKWRTCFVASITNAQDAGSASCAKDFGTLFHKRGLLDAGIIHVCILSLSAILPSASVKIRFIPFAMWHIFWETRLRIS